MEKNVQIIYFSVGCVRLSLRKMNTDHTQYLEWLEYVESYYKDSLLKALRSIPQKYEEYKENESDGKSAEVLLNDL